MKHKTLMAIFSLMMITTLLLGACASPAAPTEAPAAPRQKPPPQPPKPRPRPKL
jgi:hypothetical protein